jgi:hypothetical protein
VSRRRESQLTDVCARCGEDLGSHDGTKCPKGGGVFETRAPAAVAAKSERAKHYIGDGVYAEMRFGDLTLSTERSEGTHWIVLEPQAWAALVAYVIACKKERGG